MKHYALNAKNCYEIASCLKIDKKPLKQVIHVTVLKGFITFSVSICTLLGFDLLSCSYKRPIEFNLSYIHCVLVPESCSP